MPLNSVLILAKLENKGFISNYGAQMIQHTVILSYRCKSLRYNLATQTLGYLLDSSLRNITSA